MIKDGEKNVTGRENGMKRKHGALILALCLTISLLPHLGGTARAADEIAALTTQSNGLPYYIMVDRAQHVVTVYGLDGEGYYTVPVRAMVCSVGRPGHETPVGTWMAGERYPWCYMVDGSYGQYATRIYQGIMFHSVCYHRNDPSTLMTYEYNDLGTSVSRGCIRLQTGDAKWVYENCAWGTIVTIFDGTEPGPLEPTPKAVEYIDPADPKAGWDPTDPREENPWRAWMAENQLPFSDIRFGSRGFADIRYVYENGLMGAVEEDRFAPGSPLTRGEAVALVRRLSGAESESGPTLWHFTDLLWLLKTGEPHSDGEEVTGEALDELVCRYEMLRLGRSPKEGSVPILGTGEEVLTRLQAAAFFRAYHTIAEKRQ